MLVINSDGLEVDLYWDLPLPEDVTSDVQCPCPASMLVINSDGLEVDLYWDLHQKMLEHQLHCFFVLDVVEHVYI